MPGYRLAGVDKINLPDKFFCSLCSELLRDAVQTNCGHLYCESCLEQLSKNATTSFSCVKDGNVISNLKEQTFKDKFMRREVLALTVHCTFQNGCIWSGKVQHFEEHLRTYHNHLHCERVDNLRDVVDGILHTQENLKGVQRHLQDQQRHLQDQQRHHQDVLQNVIQQLQELRIESVDHPLALRNVILTDLEECVRQQEFSSYDGQLLWKISDYARRRNDAVTGQQVSLYSPCFYTSRHGYKMCARLYLNGDGNGRGTHISVFFVVMRGEYDALLRWPFRQKVTFMLLDQDNVKHVIDAFRPDPSSSSFQRPRREANIASGCPIFCSLAELNNHAYVRDDTMFLKIIVDTSDL